MYFENNNTGIPRLILERRKQYQSIHVNVTCTRNSLFGSNIESLRVWVFVPNLTSDELVLCQWSFPPSNQYSSSAEEVPLFSPETTVAWVADRFHGGIFPLRRGQAFQRSTVHLRSATIPCKVLQSPYCLHWVTQKIISSLDWQVVLFHQCVWFSMDMHKVFEKRLDLILQKTLNFCITPTEMGQAYAFYWSSDALLQMSSWQPRILIESFASCLLLCLFKIGCGARIVTEKKWPLSMFEWISAYDVLAPRTRARHLRNSISTFWLALIRMRSPWGDKKTLRKCESHGGVVEHLDEIKEFSPWQNVE